MRILDDGERIVHEFEVTALDLKGENYLGSVSWGYQGWNEMKEGTQDYNVQLDDVQKVSDGNPSAEFLEAATLWNRQKVIPLVSTISGPDRVKLPIPE